MNKYKIKHKSKQINNQKCVYNSNKKTHHENKYNKKIKLANK